MTGDPVVLTVELHRSAGEEHLDDCDRLLEPRDPHAGRVEGHAGLLVVRRHPSRAEPDLDPAAREVVDGREFLREHDRVPVVVGVHQTADAQCLGRRGRRRHRGDRRDLVVEVVAQEQGREAQAFDTTGRVGPRGSGRGVGRVDAEAEGMVRGHERSGFEVGSMPSEEGSAASWPPAASQAMTTCSPSVGL